MLEMVPGSFCITSLSAGGEKITAAPTVWRRYIDPDPVPGWALSEYNVFYQDYPVIEAGGIVVFSFMARWVSTVVAGVRTIPYDPVGCSFQCGFKDILPLAWCEDTGLAHMTGSFSR